MTRQQARQLKELFLEKFRRHGNVSWACREIGLRDSQRTDVYQWQENDDQFAAAFRDAEIIATEHLERVAYERAVEGVRQETPIYFKGVAIDSVVKTEYSDTLLIFMLKARAPEKYRDNQPITLQIRVEAERIAAKLGKTADEVLALAGVVAGR